MAMSIELVDMLVCPKCTGDLRYEDTSEQLVCGDCQLSYPVKDGVPVMLIDEAHQHVQGSVT